MLVGGLGDIFSTLLDSQLSQFQRGRQAASQSVTIVDGFIMGHRLRHSIRIVSWSRFVLRWRRMFSKLLPTAIRLAPASTNIPPRFCTPVLPP